MPKHKRTRIALSNDLFITGAQHDHLLKHINKRLQFGDSIRSSFVDRLEQIDIQMSGHVNLSDEDKQRDRDNKQGKSPRPVNVNVQLSEIQIDEAVTFLLGVLLPDDGTYGAISDKENQPAANALASIMNQHSTKFGHYSQFSKGLTDIMKYNFGGWLTEWEVLEGKKINSTPDGRIDVDEGVILAGNKLTAIDPYNIIWDIAVPPTEIANKGEFFALVDLKRPFAIERMLENEEIFGIDRIFESNGNIKGTNEEKYYRQPPQLDARANTGSGINWIKTLTASEAGMDTVDDANEVLNYWGWIKPEEFGLKTKAESGGKMEIWRFTVINNSFIVAGAQMTNAHGMLPVSISTPIENALGMQTKSYAEQLLPFQIFASSQLNTHQRANRRALYGLTVYDKSILPQIDEVNTEELEAGFLAADLSGRPDKNIDKAFRTYNDTPNTDNTMRDFDLLLNIMQRVLPTNVNNQVASLERATQYQAASLVQGSNKRNFKIAKIINDQAATHVRTIMYYNILQFQETVEVIDEKTGQLVEANPTQFRKAKIEWALSDGLKGIDRLLITENIKEVVGMILQSNVAVNKFNIIEIVNYWTSMLGDKTDFTQFENKDILDTLDPEQRQIAIQLYEQFVQQQQQQVQQQPAGNGAIAQLAGAV